MLSLLLVFFSVRDRKKPLVKSTRQAMTIPTTAADGRSKGMHILLVYVTNFILSILLFKSLNFCTTFQCHCLKCDSLSSYSSLYSLKGIKFVTHCLFHCFICYENWYLTTTTLYCPEAVSMNMSCYAAESVGLWMLWSPWRKQINPIGHAWNDFISFLNSSDQH